MISLAIPAVCAAVSFSRPLILTPTSLPPNSICGGRPGLKIRSLTFSETLNISRSTVTKLGGGGPAARLFAIVGCSVLIFRLNVYRRGGRQRPGYSWHSQVKRNYRKKNQLITPCVHPSEGRQRTR